MVIGICLLAIPQPAAAVTITVKMDGTHQVIKDNVGTALATGDAIQIIYASGGTPNPPDSGGGATGGDSIIWAGHVGDGGLGSGAFIKVFAGGQSLTDGARIYVRGWNNSSFLASTYYGDSELSATLEAGEPPMPIEWSVPTFETSSSTAGLAGNTPLGYDVQVNLNGVSVVFSEVTKEGNTYIVSSEEGPDLPGSFGFLGKYFNISTTAFHSGTIEVSLPYNDYGLSIAEEQQLKLEQYDGLNKVWNDITTTVETTSNIISGETSHLSYFAIVTTAPTLEWVEINGMPFHSGDVISAHSDVAVRLSDEKGVSTVELKVEDTGSPPSYIHFTFDPSDHPPSSTFEGTWKGSFMIHRGKSRTVPLHFSAGNSAGVLKDYPVYLGRVVGGAVTVVGRAYNYPNPFKPMSGGTTNIQYVLSQDATITLVIYDITGHEVKRMRFGSGTAGGRGGTNQVAWNGQSIGGDIVGNGMYLYKIISGDEVIGSGKLVVFD